MRLEEERNSNKQKGNINRRKLLSGLVGLGATAVTFGPPVLNAIRNRRAQEERSQDTLTDEDRRIPSPDELDESFLNVPYSPREYTFGRIADRRIDKNVNGRHERKPVEFGGLLTKYTGISGPVPKNPKIDFRYQLAQLWKEKLALMRKRKNGLVYVADRMKHIRDLFTPYNVDTSTPTTIENYRQAIDTSIREARAGLNLNNIRRLEAFRHLTDAQVQLLKKLESGITQDTFLAYIVTELMPTKGRDAVLGPEILDELLQHGGREYVSLLPALHDSDFSFGDGQMTEKAVSERVRTRPGKREGTVISEEDFGGASLINKLFSERRVPKHIADLRGNQHHVAAHLFAIYNIARLVENMGNSLSEEMLAMRAVWPRDLVGDFVAAAHNRPTHAIDAFKEYVKATRVYVKASPDKRKTMSEPSYLEYARQQKDGKGKTSPIGSYIEKTRDNLGAIRLRFGS